MIYVQYFIVDPCNLNQNKWGAIFDILQNYYFNLFNGILLKVVIL